MRRPWVDHRKLPGVAKSDITLKMVALLCVIFVIIALLIMYQSPATGYEQSIYSATPFGVWFLLALSLLGGLGIVIHQLATGRYQETRTCLFGLAVVLLTATAFLCLPVIRNYYSWRGDQLAHIGFVKDIATSGHLPGYNPYPVTHTMLFEISAVLDWPIHTVVNLNTPLIFIVFVLVMFLLTTVVLPNRGQQLMATLFTAGTVAALSRFNLVPNTWSILLLPLFFYCYFRRDEPPFKVLLVLLIIAYPFIHPLSALIIIVSLIAIEFFKPIYSRLLRRTQVEVPSWISAGPVIWPLALELLVFLPWVFTRQAFRSSVDGLWWQLVNFSGSGQGSAAVGKLSKVDLDAFGIVMILVKLYGEILLLGVLACVGILLVYRQLRSGGRDDGGDAQGWSRDGGGDPSGEEPPGGNDNRFRLVFMGVLFVLSTVAYFAFYAGAPGAESLSATRIIVYVEVFAIPLVGFVLWELATRAKRQAPGLGPRVHHHSRGRLPQRRRPSQRALPDPPRGPGEPVGHGRHDMAPVREGPHCLHVVHPGVARPLLPGHTGSHRDLRQNRRTGRRVAGVQRSFRLRGLRAVRDLGQLFHRGGAVLLVGHIRQHQQVRQGGLPDRLAEPGQVQRRRLQAD